MQVPAPEITKVSVKNIKPYFNNPRINDQAVPGLKESIQQYGFVVPLVVDKDMVIVTGHTRFKAALELGMSEVPCIIATHLSDEKVKAFRIADNRLSENAKWDEVALSTELRQLTDMGFGQIFTGFSPEELDCLCGTVTADCLDDLSYAAVCGQVDEKAVVARGDIIVSVGNYRFYLDMKAYKAWEAEMLKSFPKKQDMILELLKRLGFKPSDMPDKTKKKPGQETKEVQDPTVH